MPASAGHQARLAYLWEDDGSGNPDFATDSPSDDTYKTFGANATMNTLEGSNNAVRVFDPGDREAAEVIEQQFEGSWSVEFTLTNPWWLRSVLDNGFSTSGSSAPYTHSLSGGVPYSMRIVQPTESTDSERVLLGCVATSASISVDTGGLVSVSLEGAYADDEISTGVGSLTSQPTRDEDPLHFGHASISRDGGSTTLSLVQDASLQINNNTDIVLELGSRVGADYSPKQLTADVDYTDIVENSDDVQRMYGDATSVQTSMENHADIVFEFDNGGTGSDKNSLKFTLSDALPDTGSRSGVGDPEADLEDQLNEMAATITAEAQNGTQTPI